MTGIPVTIQRPERWSSPFGPAMTDEDVDRLLAIPPFGLMDSGKFPRTAALRDILRNDTRILRCHMGDIIVRKADYGSSAFLVLAGAVRVVLDDLPGDLLGRRQPQRKSLYQALSQLWTNAKVPEARDPALYARDSRLGARSDERDQRRVFLQDVPAILDKRRTVRLEAGQLFGEIAALGRTPRTATVLADGETELLEIRWQGLRDIRRCAPEFREHIDRLYREHSLKIHLQETPMFRHLTGAQLDELAEQTRFETYGKFDWYGTYKALAESESRQRLEQEPIIAEEGHYPNDLVLIRSGFARLSQRLGHGERTISYLGKGMTFGFEEIANNWRAPAQVPWRHTLRAVGYVDVLLIPTALIESLVLPSMPPDRLPAPLAAAEPATPTVADPARSEHGAVQSVPSGMLEFLVENRFTNGTATMFIDLDRCTRCDDCVRACAATHDNNPRFIRHGPQYGRYMVANACMHCVDPVCMIGCPTGAIHRESAQGQVVINDLTCIGCSVCASSCPYDNIRMVPIRDAEGGPILDEASRAPILKATKCDLCIDQTDGVSPACERACPHDALKRIDMQDVAALAAWLKR